MKKLSIITILLLLLASVLWAADATYGPKFYRTDGGDKAVVASGGSIVVESGGALTLDSGSTLTGSGTMNLTSPTITTGTLSGTVTLSTATLSGGATLSGTFTGGTLASQTLTGSTITSPTVTGIDTTYNVSTHEYTTDADWAMSATEAKSILLSVSSGSGALNIVAPDVSGRLYVVRNGSAGTVGSVTIKKSGGTGITIASGKTAILMHNGSDYIRVTADGTH